MPVHPFLRRRSWSYRLASLALALLTLNLSLLGAGASCTTGAHESSVAATSAGATSEGATSADAAQHDAARHAPKPNGVMPMHMGAMHEHASANANASSDNGVGTHDALADAAPSANLTTQVKAHDGAPPCESPAPSNCCRALASCTVLFSVHGATNAPSVNQMSLMIASGVSDSPLSEIVTPEPPPPKVLPA